MTASIPTPWKHEADAAFFDIARSLSADGLFADTPGWTERLEKMLDNLTVAASYEAMAARSLAHSTPRDRELVPVPVAAPRRTTR